jgi:GxxExxY protein
MREMYIVLLLKCLNTKGTKDNTKDSKEKNNIMDLEAIFKKILDCCFRIHSDLGPGLLESVYVECLNFELERAGLNVQKQKPLPLVHNEVKLDAGFRIDLLVEDKVVIEVKSVEALADIHLAQTLTYLRLSKCKIGLLVNFNVTHLKNGIKRVIH